MNQINYKEEDHLSVSCLTSGNSWERNLIVVCTLSLTLHSTPTESQDTAPTTAETEGRSPTDSLNPHRVDVRPQPECGVMHHTTILNLYFNPWGRSKPQRKITLKRCHPTCTTIRSHRVHWKCARTCPVYLLFNMISTNISMCLSVENES